MDAFFNTCVVDTGIIVGNFVGAWGLILVLNVDDITGPWFVSGADVLIVDVNNGDFVSILTNVVVDFVFTVSTVGVTFGVIGVIVQDGPDNDSLSCLKLISFPFSFDVVAIVVAEEFCT